MALPKPQSKNTEDRPLHPAKPTQVVLAEVVYMGYKVGPNKFKKGNPLEAKQKIRFVFQSSRIMPDALARRFLLTREFTYSLHENSLLRPWLKGWRGVDIASDAEGAALLQSLDSWAGKNGRANIIHTVSGDKTYTDIDGLTPLDEGVPDIQVVGYERPEWINDTIAKYAEGFAAWEQEKLAAQVTGAANASKAKSPDPVGSFDDLPAALTPADDDDLPFS